MSKLCLSLGPFLCLIMSLNGCANQTVESLNISEASASGGSVIKLVSQTVEASCGECQFEMEGTGCDLAVRIDGRAYYVDGSSMDDHGNAHGEQGMCNCVRQAKVTGEIKEGRFVATSFELLPLDESAASEPHEHGHEDSHSHTATKHGEEEAHKHGADGEQAVDHEHAEEKQQSDRH